MGISIMLLSLSNLALIVIGWHFFQQARQMFEHSQNLKGVLDSACAERDRFKTENEELLRQKKSLTPRIAEAQHGPKKVSGAELRRIVGAENSRFLSKKERPNSEVLKENENG